MSYFSPRSYVRTWKRTFLTSGAVVIFLLLTGLVSYSRFFGAVDTQAVPAEFVIQPGTSIQEAAQLVAASGVTRSSWALRVALLKDSERADIRGGGYSIGKNMDVWTLAKVLTDPPAIAFVTFPPGIRKEQIGAILADELNWSAAQEKEWITVATNPDPNFVEGVYYPDTYLIPSDQSPTQIAARMRGRFTDVFAPYAKEAQRQNIPWVKVLTLASIVDREASKDDKALVAGILWNRLENGMRLQADATLQYAKGTEGNWWPQPTSADKYVNSPFNTYKHAGLPPHPINNPSLSSINAVLHPVTTDCIFYLHDNDHQIHCSLTYAGQVRNVDRYLR